MLMAQVLALSSAICSALSSVLINELNGRVPLMTLARWQVSAAFLFTAVIATAAGGWATVGAWQAGLLVLSSISGIVLATSTYFATIYAVGPRITALLFSLTSPFALLIAYLALGETIGRGQGAGTVLILVGILIAVVVRQRRPPAMIPLSDAEPIEAPAVDKAVTGFGILLGVVTAFGQALGSLLARPAMASGVEPFAAVAVRLGVGALFFWALLLVPRLRNEPVWIKGRDLVFAVVSAFVGAALGMSALMAALATGSVGIVSTLSSMTPIVILPMVWLRSGKMPNPAAWGGAALAIAGVAMISLA